MNVVIKQCKYEDIKHFKNIVSKERVTLETSNNCIWWKAIIDNEIIGFVCLSINKNNARFKSDYVLKPFRRQGVYKQLFNTRFEYAKINNINKITAFCTKYSVQTYLSNGFIIKNKNKNNIYFVERILYK